jgi:hypothetical protein
VVFTGVEGGHDSSMMQRRGDAAPLKKLHEERPIAQELLSRQYDRDSAMEHVVESQPALGGGGQRYPAFETVASVDQAGTYGH